MKTKTKRQNIVSRDNVRKQWEKVGIVGVDSGQLMICDPSYIDSSWVKDQEPAGHDILVLSASGRACMPKLQGFRAQFPFPWGSYSDLCPELGMSINSANEKGLLVKVDVTAVRDFSYRGACDVSYLKGRDFGQLNFHAGHSGAGVAFSSGYGDGVYPVYARRNKAGRILEVRIMMD